MKRYLLFFGGFYYPGGGMNDYWGDFDSIEDCEKAMKEEKLKNPWKDLDWANIYDKTEDRIIDYKIEELSELLNT